MSDYMPVGTKVSVTMYDCGEGCGGPHQATIIEVDPDDPELPYRVEFDNGAGDTWAGADEVSAA